MVLTGDLEENEALRLMRLGVSGIVLKEMAPQLLVQCVRKAHAGEPWVERRSVSRVLNKLLRYEAGAHEFSKALTPRELEVVHLAVSGLHSKEIGEKLHISEGTVKVHLHNIYKKLRLGGRLALLLYAQDRGLV